MAGTQGTVSVTEEIHGSVKKIKFTWMSGTGDYAGAASGQTSHPYSGKVERLVTVPGVGGDAPSADYDITIKDEDEIDVLAGAGANRHTANTEQVLAANLGIVANDKLTFAVANVGDSNKGTAYLYIR